MTKDLFKFQDSSLIDINGIANKAGISAEVAKSAGEILFAKLAGQDVDLTKALVHAATNSGADPKQILDMLRIIGDEFAKPLPEAGPGLTEQLSNIGSAAGEQVSQLADNVKDRLADIDISSAKDKGLELGHQVADKASSVFQRAKAKFTKE